MKITLDHIGIAVKDLAAALAFYRDALGLEIEGTEDVDSQKVRAHFAGVGEARLELLEATAPGSPIAKYIEKRGPGLHHITLRVEDIGAALAQPVLAARLAARRLHRARMVPKRADRGGQVGNAGACGGNGLDDRRPPFT